MTCNARVIRSSSPHPALRATFSPPSGAKDLSARPLAPRERGEGGRRPGEGSNLGSASENEHVVVERRPARHRRHLFAKFAVERAFDRLARRKMQALGLQPSTDAGQRFL